MADVNQNFTVNPFGSNVTGSGTANVGDTFTLNITTGGTIGTNNSWSIVTQPSAGTLSLSLTTGDDTVATFSGASAGVYTFVIRASAFTGTSDFTYTATVEAVADQPPTTPTTFNISPTSGPTGTVITLSASGSTDPESNPITYEYRMRTSTDGGQNYGSYTTPSSTNTFTVPGGDTTNTRYQFQARATANGLSSGYTTDRTFTVTGTTPPPDGDITYGAAVFNSSGVQIWGTNHRNISPLITTGTVSVQILAGRPTTFVHTAQVTGIEDWTLTNTGVIFANVPAPILDNVPFITSITQRLSTGFEVGAVVNQTVSSSYSVNVPYQIIRGG